MVTLAPSEEDWEELEEIVLRLEEEEPTLKNVHFLSLVNISFVLFLCNVLIWRTRGEGER